MANKNKSDINWTPIILLGLGYIMVKDVVGPDKEEKQTKDLEKSELKDNPFTLTYALPKKEGYRRMPTNATALRNAATKINKAIGYVYDDEAEIMGGIKTAKTKYEVFAITVFYDKDFSRDLYTDLKKNLNSSELGEINTYVNKLPPYIKGATN